MDVLLGAFPGSHSRVCKMGTFAFLFFFLNLSLFPHFPPGYAMVKPTMWLISPRLFNNMISYNMNICLYLIFRLFNDGWKQTFIMHLLPSLRPNHHNDHDVHDRANDRRLVGYCDLLCCSHRHCHETYVDQCQSQVSNILDGRGCGWVEGAGVCFLEGIHQNCYGRYRIKFIVSRYRF